MENFLACQVRDFKKEFGDSPSNPDLQTKDKDQPPEITLAEDAQLKDLTEEQEIRQFIKNKFKALQ